MSKDPATASIRYHLRPAPLGKLKAEKKLIPISATRGRVSTAQLAEEIINLGTTVRPADVAAVLLTLGEAVKARCARGESVTLPGFGIVSPHIGGYTNQAGEWEKGPDVYLSMRFDSAMLKSFKGDARLMKVAAPKFHPTISRYLGGDLPNQSEELLQIGGHGQILGKHLKFDHTQEDEGLFIHPENQPDAGIRITEIANHTSTRIIFGLPKTLKAGEKYAFKLFARTRGTQDLRSSGDSPVLIATVS